MELGVGCAWWCRKGKSFPDLNAPPKPDFASRQKLRCKAVLGHLPLLLHPSSWGFPSSLPQAGLSQDCQPREQELCPDILPRRKEDAGSEKRRSSAATILRSRSRNMDGTAAALLWSREGMGKCSQGAGACDHDQLAGCEKRNQIWCCGYGSVMVPSDFGSVCASSVGSCCARTGNEHLWKASALQALLYCSAAFFRNFYLFNLCSWKEATMTEFRFSGHLRHTFLAFVPILICHVADKHSTELRFTMAVLKHLFWRYKNRAAVWSQNLFYFQDRKLQCSQSSFARCLQPKCFWSFPVLWYSILPNPIRSPDQLPGRCQMLLLPLILIHSLVDLLKNYVKGENSLLYWRVWYICPFFHGCIIMCPIPDGLCALYLFSSSSRFK